MGQGKIAPSRLRHTTDHIVGRDDELQCLSSAWNNPAIHVYTIVAWGGAGKTTIVAKWAAGLAARNYDGADFFDWSFYSQGTREQGAAYDDSFIAAALDFFGDPDMAKSAASPWDKGARLARLIGERRALLVLDGVEPLQYPPASPLAGQLKNPGLLALLNGLAQQNPGLCVVTTRESLTDLAPFLETTAPECELDRLSVPAGVELLKILGVTGPLKEFERLVEDVKGHALTLNLLGRYLAEAHGGDIHRRDIVKFEEADAEEQGGHAFRVMETYEKWFAAEGDKGQRCLAVLRMMGLFDRPADSGCLTALRKPPVIPGLTEPLANLTDAQWNIAVNRLVDCGLISLTVLDQLVTRNPELGTGLDTHPLIREYFAEQLREQKPEPLAWRAGHKRLYEYLTTTTPDKSQPTIEDLQPLYQAVAHGCKAGLLKEAIDEVYIERILRGDEHYSWRKLGAFGDDLGAISYFFDSPWSRLSSTLKSSTQALLLSQAAFYLHTQGRLTEALEPMQVGVKVYIQQKNWEAAAVTESNLSGLKLMLGDISGAVNAAERAVTFADQSGNIFHQTSKRTRLAEVLHQAGRRDDALVQFREAEATQAKRLPQYPLLYSLQGFLYCDFLLAGPERAAWQTFINPKGEGQNLILVEACREVEHRGKTTLKWLEASREGSLLDIALNHLSLARGMLYRTILEHSPLGNMEFKLHSCLTETVDYLRRAGDMTQVPHGLLTRAWLCLLIGDINGTERDLNESWHIAEQGHMQLLLSDIHLYNARLFHDRNELKKAHALIEKCGYWRRREELIDAEEAAERW